ncbi:hypothetical protein [Nitrosococcus watsonii]|uniref:Uncharacterized protein n=1 Tax=Nitrosococcus watsoni (strain C-113) TaxID=105559 RepID=D8K4X4_NITWC|nr:hypothetical protein [Nitrosococcus watsonii]ADJ27951.1 conserved hypothetical protein [Nitrosococcus watsonii C-113]
MERVIVFLFISVALNGCATVNSMAVDKGTRTVDTAAKSIVLMTIDIFRSDNSRHVPIPIVVKLEKPNAQSNQDRQNFKLAKNTDAVEENGHTIYMARIALEPGLYKLAEVSGQANAFPFYGTTFMVPLLLDLEVAPHSVTYIGRVTAELWPRQEGEFRAGSIIPLIEQSVAGISTGTWDITVDDRSEKDIALFRANYPALATIPINSNPLPSFDRAALQR